VFLVEPRPSRTNREDASKAASHIFLHGRGRTRLAMQNVLRKNLKGLWISEDDQIIREWAFQDEILEINSIDSEVIKKFAEARFRHYQDMFSKISPYWTQILVVIGSTNRSIMMGSVEKNAFIS